LLALIKSRHKWNGIWEKLTGIRYDLLYLCVHHIFVGTLIQEYIGKKNLQDQAIAETWEVNDVENTGATIKNGEFEGKNGI